jgi:hypothetical protein
VFINGKANQVVQLLLVPLSTHTPTPPRLQRSALATWPVSVTTGFSKKHAVQWLNVSFCIQFKHIFNAKATFFMADN